MSLNLFRIDAVPAEFEKRSNLAVQLSNPPEEWDQEILEYAYRLHPWLADFTLNVEFLKKLPDRQYGLGGITVRPKKPLIPASRGTAGPGQADLVLAHIPVIIREGTLSPIDIFLVGDKVIPLNEDSFRKLVGSALDASSTSPSRNDPTLIGHLWPPGRSSFGGPGAEMGISVLNKFSSLSSEGEHEFFYTQKNLAKLAEDDLHELLDNQGFPLVAGILEGKLAYSREKAQKLADLVQSSTYLRPRLGELMTTVLESLPGEKAPRGKVAQLLSTPDGDYLRSTSPEAFSFDRGVVVEDLRRSSNSDAEVYTSMPARAKLKTASKTAAAPVELPAMSSAFLKEGSRQRVGLFVRDVYDFNGEKIAESLFVDAESRAWSLEANFEGLQPETKLAGLDSSPMQGTGMFLFKTAEGELACTVPVTLHRRDVSNSGPLFHATVHGTKLAGELGLDTTVKLFFSPAVTHPVYTAKTASLVLPTSFSWVQIGGDRFRPHKPLDLSTNVVEVTKLAGDSYELSGAPVAAVVRRPLNTADAQFTLAALGLPVEEIDGVLKQAHTVLESCNVLRPYTPRRIDFDVSGDAELLKAAAYLEDPNTVDAVIGLNLMDFEIEDDYMITAQNLELAQQKVARLLLLSRLGLGAIPEGASKVVMLRLTPVIDALKVLAMQQAYVN